MISSKLLLRRLNDLIVNRDDTQIGENFVYGEIGSTEDVVFKSFRR